MNIVPFIAAILLLSSCRPLPEVPLRYSNTDLERGVPEGETDKILRIIAIDVGEGDSTLIITPAKISILIDGGPPGMGYKKIIPLMDEEGIEKLDYIFASHYDIDHIGGIIEVIKGVDAEYGTADDITPLHGIYDRGGNPRMDNDIITEYFNTKEDCNHVLEAGDIFKLENDVSITVVVSNGILANGAMVDIEPDDENAHSVGLLVTYKDFKYFTAGDLPGGGGEPPYQTVDVETPLAPLIGDIDVLHVSHHGSNTSTNQYFLDVLKPEAAIISVGNGNDYWHPHKSVVTRLLKAGVNIYLTERGFAEDIEDLTIANGNIYIESDGEDFWVNPNLI